MGCTASDGNGNSVTVEIKVEFKDLPVHSLKTFFNDAQAFVKSFTDVAKPLAEAKRKFIFYEAGFPVNLKGVCKSPPICLFSSRAQARHGRNAPPLLPALRGIYYFP